MNTNTTRSGADVLQEGSTVYVLNARGANRWWASVQPGQDDEGKRTSDDECKQIAHAIRAALSAAQEAPDEAAQAVPHGWPRAAKDQRDQGWTLEYRFLERVTDLAASRTEYSTSMEATEQVLIAALEVLAAAPAAPQPAAQQGDALSYVHPVPDHCDRVVWRNRYLHLAAQAQEAAPAAQQPLTDEQAASLAKQLGWDTMPERFPLIVRAIEQAHGIGVKND